MTYLPDRFLAVLEVISGIRVAKISVMLFKYKHLQYQVLDVHNFLDLQRPGDLAIKIARKANKGHFDFIIFKMPPFGRGGNGKEHHHEVKMIYEVLKLTGCPVVSITKWPVNRIFRNILQPVDPSINLIERYEQILPIIKVFNANIHLLLVNNTSSLEVSETCQELLDLSSEYFLQFDINVKSKIINHLNKSDTILAYASIIGADLIGNGTGHSDLSEPDLTDITWNNLICRSDIPLFNYFG